MVNTQRRQESPPEKWLERLAFASIHLLLAQAAEAQATLVVVVAVPVAMPLDTQFLFGNVRASKGNSRSRNLLGVLAAWCREQNANKLPQERDVENDVHEHNESACALAAVQVALQVGERDAETGQRRDE